MDGPDTPRQLLTEIIDCIEDGAAIFDADDRLVQFNESYTQFFSLIRDLLKPGISFNEMFQALARRGLYDGPESGIEDWVARRVKLFADGVKGNEFQSVDGSWVRVDYHKLPTGGTFVATADINERKQLEQALHRSESRYRAIAGVAPVGIFHTNADGDVTYVNEKWCQLGGMTSEAAIGKGWLKAIHPDDRERVSSNWYQVTNTTKHFENEYRYVNSDGVITWCFVQTLPEMDEAGDIVGYVGALTDITDLKRTEEALRDSQARLTDAIESISEAFILFDSDERLVICNDKYREQFPMIADILVPGAKLEDLVRSGAEIGQIADAIGNVEGWVRKRLHQYRSPGQEEPFELQLGNGRWVLTSERRTREGGIVGIRTDITERKRAEDALRESEARYRELFDESPAAIWVEDWSPIKQMLDDLARGGVKDWRGYFNSHRDQLKTAYDLAQVIDISRAAVELYREESKEHMLRLTTAEAVIDEELDAFREMVLAFLAGRTTFDIEAKDTAGDGSEIIVRRRLVVPPHHRHDWSRVIYAIEDITERKRAEEALRESEARFKAILDNAPVEIYLKDKDGRHIVVGRRSEELFGKPDDPVLGKTAHELFPKQFADEHRAHDRAVLESGKALELEYEIPFEDGVHTFLSVKFPIPDPAGESALIGAVTMDITERKRAEEQLRQAQKMEAIGQLTGGIAHDFNNLLQIIIGAARLLQNKVGEDQVAKLSIEAIIAGVDRGASLTNRLLAFSRQTIMSPVATDVTDLIGSLEDMLRRTLGETVDLRVETIPDLWPATIDAHQFENALVNLALNARDAMPQGGTLTIETANVTLDETYAEQNQEVTLGDYVQVAVSDTGAGIPPEVLEKVFEPFFTTKEVGKGSGLGLSMVFGFAKQSKGHITIYSEVGHGTTVKLYIPRSEEDFVQAGAKDDMHEFARGSERILVVEDDENVRRDPVIFLRDQGYEVVEAGDGKEAIERLKDGLPFDLLFTDVVLPGGMNGVEIAEQAKRINPGIKVLFTTGYAENAIVHHGKLDAGETLVNKPYRQAELLGKVRAMLDGKSN